MNLRHRIGESDKNGAAAAAAAVSSSPFRNKRRSCLTFPKCIVYAILAVLVVVMMIVVSWYNYFNNVWNSDYSYYYHENDNADSLSDWLATRTMTTEAASTNSTTFAAAASRSSQSIPKQRVDSSNILDVESVAVNDNHKCAILFYGLPRSFRLLVLPSVIQNIVRPNARHQCDYFVHYYDVQSYEAPSRSGYGGFINTSEILLLQSAVVEIQKQHEDSTTISRSKTTRSSIVVHFTSDTNASFWQYQNGLYKNWMHKIRTTKGKRRFIKQHPVDKHLSTQLMYLPVKDATYSFQTCENILKMWHSQSSVYRLMMQQQQEQEQGDFNNYTRVALFRSDVVYVTPIDIWKRAPIVNAASAASNAEAGQRQRNESPVLDVDNTQAVIPAFAKFPVNDRMFYGPAAAAKIWATQRLERLENHVLERILQLDPGFGMHSERYLYYTIFPAIRNETRVEIAEDDGICLLRARADESVWINDCDSVTNNKSNSNINSRGTMEEYRAMIESMIGRTCQQSRLPKEIHTRVIQLRCGLNETKVAT